MSNRQPRPKPSRRVDVHAVTRTQQIYGDSYRDEAQGRIEDDYRVKIQVHLPMDTKEDARWALGRLIFAMRTDHAGVLEDSDADVQELDGAGNITKPGRAYAATAYWTAYDEAGFHQLRDLALVWAQEIRDGRHDPPTVTVDQARAFSELGIALRPDGIFGYKRKCGNTACDEPGGTGDCFGSLDPAEAIEGAKKRDITTCSMECWLDGGEAWGLDPTKDLVLDHVNHELDQDLIAALQAAGCLKLEDEEVPDVQEARYSLVDGWWQNAKLHDEAKQLVLQLAEEAAEGGDCDGNEDAIDCMV